MELGYDGKLYILAFDHRGSFQKKMFGIEGDPTPEQTDTISDAKHLIFEGLVKAAERGAEPTVSGCLVDEQFGAPKGIPQQAKERGLVLAMPVEKSGQKEFDFEYGEQFGEHIERFDPEFSKVLVRYNPDGDAEMNRRQAERLRRLSDWLHEHDRKFLFELLVPAEESQLEQVGGDADRYDAELRPELMRRVIAELQDIGVEPDVWKIEGIDSQEDCRRIAEQTRSRGSWTGRSSASRRPSRSPTTTCASSRSTTTPRPERPPRPKPRVDITLVACAGHADAAVPCPVRGRLPGGGGGVRSPPRGVAPPGGATLPTAAPPAASQAGNGEVRAAVPGDRGHERARDRRHVRDPLAARRLTGLSPYCCEFSRSSASSTGSGSPSEPPVGSRSIST